MPVSFSFSVSFPPATPVAADASPNTVAGAGAMRDKRIDHLTGDLSIVNGDQTYTSGVEAIAADLKSNWLFVKGEWYLDINKGVDYWGVVFKKGATLEAIEEEFRREGLATRGVTAVTLTTTKLRGRILDIAATITVDTGQIFTVLFAANAGS